MKILIQSILFILIVGIFAITSDQLSRIENATTMGATIGAKNVMSDAEFLDNAIPHHEGAVIMAQVVLENSERPELRNFAQSVITGESKSIAQLYEWRRDWYGKQDRIFLDQVSPKVSMIIDLGEKDPEFDLRFLEAMIAHHQGAINMLQGILIPTARPEIHSTATAGVVALAADINTMQQWKKDWYGK
jgi:uncharacterized protein (DUF305 family)